MTKTHKMMGMEFNSMGFPKVAAAVPAPIRASDAAVAAIKAQAMVPSVCGPDIPAAPARGPYQTFRPVEMVPGSDVRLREAGYRAPGEAAPRLAIRRVGPILAMIADAQGRHAARADGSEFVPPFTWAQVAMADRYAALVERMATAGAKGQKFEAGSGGGDRTGFIEAYLRDADEMRRLRVRIGTGSAMSVRRVRPSARGSRVSITDAALVQMVCVDERDLADVLRAHGWSVKGSHREALRAALAGALDRMMGYDLTIPTR